MPCPCPTNTLRLFIRSLAQLDLSSSTTRASHSNWQKHAIRSFSSTGRDRSGNLIDNATSVSKSYIPFENLTSDASKPQYGSQEWAKEVVDGKLVLEIAKTGETQPTKDADVEVSQDLGDSDGGKPPSSRIANRKLRKERRRREQRTVGAKPVRAGLSKNAFRRQNRSDGLQGKVPVGEIQPVIRKIGEKKTTYNSGFKIHYSNPISPVSSRPPKPARKPDIKSFDVSKDREKKDGDEWEPPTREQWQIDKEALKAKFPEGWKPMRRLSPDALSGIRALHAQDPAQYTTAVLSNSFEVSAEAMRRILKSKWSPSAAEETDRARRWENRGKSVYSRFVELGVLKPPRKWRDMGIGKGKPEWLVKKRTYNREKAERERMGENFEPGIITAGRRRDEKYGLVDNVRVMKKEREPMPALVTTRRFEDGGGGLDGGNYEERFL